MSGRSHEKPVSQNDQVMEDLLLGQQVLKNPY